MQSGALHRPRPCWTERCCPSSDGPAAPLLRYEVDREARAAAPAVPPLGPAAAAAAEPLLPDPHGRVAARSPQPAAEGCGAAGWAEAGPLAAGGAFADPGPSVPDQLR